MSSFVIDVEQVALSFTSVSNSVVFFTSVSEQRVFNYAVFILFREYLPFFIPLLLLRCFCGVLNPG